MYIFTSKSKFLYFFVYPYSVHSGISLCKSCSLDGGDPEKSLPLPCLVTAGDSSIKFVVVTSMSNAKRRAYSCAARTQPMSG